MGEVGGSIERIDVPAELLIESLASALLAVDAAAPFVVRHRLRLALFSWRSFDGEVFLARLVMGKRHAVWVAIFQMLLAPLIMEKPWQDVHVRRAVAYATDKVGLVKAVLRGYGQPAPVMPPPE